MADFMGVTACNPAKVTDTKAVKDLVSKYVFGEVTVELEGDLLWVYGYDWLDVRGLKPGEDGELEVDYDGDWMDEFFEALRPLIAEGSKLEIGCVGNEKCRYVSAMKATVTRDEVKYETLGT